MKKEFIGFYDPTEQEIEDAWTNGIFAFDANTLLNLYRYTDVTRKDFLHALKSIREKLFIPYQVAYEYLNNRVAVIDGLEKSYFDIEKSLKDNFENILKKTINGFKRHPSIDVVALLKQQEEFLKKVSAELEKQKKKHPNFKAKDYVLDDLTELFEKCVGKEPLKSEIKKIYLDGKERYSEEIPPGYKDLKEKEKKGERHLYGDLLIWKELIEFSKKSKRPLIFVTDDRKEDWWKIENGKTIRPREELIKEFYDLTGIRILIYNADHFLKFAKEKGLVSSIKEETISEVKEIRNDDEHRIIYPHEYQYLRPWLFGGMEKINEISSAFTTAQQFYNPISNIIDSANLYNNLPFVSITNLKNITSQGENELQQGKTD